MTSVPSAAGRIHTDTPTTQKNPNNRDSMTTQASAHPSKAALWNAALPGAERVMKTQRWPDDTQDMVMNGLKGVVKDDADFDKLVESSKKFPAKDLIMSSMIHAVQNATSMDAAPIEVMAYAADCLLAKNTGAPRRYQ